MQGLKGSKRIDGRSEFKTHQSPQPPKTHEISFSGDAFHQNHQGLVVIKLDDDKKRSVI